MLPLGEKKLRTAIQKIRRILIDTFECILRPGKLGGNIIKSVHYKYRFHVITKYPLQLTINNLKSHHCFQIFYQFLWKKCLNIHTPAAIVAQWNPVTYIDKTWIKLTLNHISVLWNHQFTGKCVFTCGNEEIQYHRKKLIIWIF